MLHTVQVHALEIKCHKDKRKFQDAFDAARHLLKKTGENINHSQSEAVLKSEIVKEKHFAHEISTEISRMKKMEDECKLAIMAILCDILPTLHLI